MRVWIKGAGDLATGVAQALHLAGMDILMTEAEQPLAIRRTVSLAQAVYQGQFSVENLEAVLAADLNEAWAIIAQNKIPILIDFKMKSLADYRPHVMIDATLAKRNGGFKLGMAPLMIGLGPGFCAGTDVNVVIETMRGHDLGRLIYQGMAKANTGVPGDIGGIGLERLLKATADGEFRQNSHIGAAVKKGDIVAYCGDQPIYAQIDGMLRGLLMQGLTVHQGMKVGDIDPRHNPEYCYSISDKARSLGGAALIAIMQWRNQVRG